MPGSLDAIPSPTSPPTPTGDSLSPPAPEPEAKEERKIPAPVSEDQKALMEALKKLENL